MDFGQIVGELIGGNGVLLALAVFIIICVMLGVRIVPQSEKHVVETVRAAARRARAGHQLHRAVP